MLKPLRLPLEWKVMVDSRDMAGEAGRWQELSREILEGDGEARQLRKCKPLGFYRPPQRAGLD